MSKAAELAALIGSQTALSNRNLIINGAMQVAQRGTSVTGLTSSSTYQTVDRYKVEISACGTFTVAQSSDAPDGFANSFQINCTTADASLDAGSLFIFSQRLEGQDLQRFKKGTSAAESMTVSFYIKAHQTGNFVLELVDEDNGPRQICALVTINSANTWEYKTVTFDGDTIGSFGDDNGSSLAINFWFVAGTTFSSGTLSTSWAARVDGNRAAGTDNFADTTGSIYITGIQLEVGEQATPFEHRSYGDELARCQRYYQKSYSPGVCPGATSGAGIGASIMYRAYGTGQLRFSGQFKQSFRDVPTVTAYSPYSGNSAHCSENSSTTDKNIGGAQASTELFYAPMTENCVDGRTYEIAFEAESEL